MIIGRLFPLGLEAFGNHESVEFVSGHFGNVQTLQLRIAGEKDKLGGFAWEGGKARHGNYAYALITGSYLEEKMNLFIPPIFLNSVFSYFCSKSSKMNFFTSGSLFNFHPPQDSTLAEVISSEALTPKMEAKRRTARTGFRDHISRVEERRLFCKICTFTERASKIVMKL